MDWPHYLRVKTQQPEFLRNLVIGILATSAVIGGLVQFLPSVFGNDRLTRIDQIVVAASFRSADEGLALLTDYLNDATVDVELKLDAIARFADQNRDSSEPSEAGESPREVADLDAVRSQLVASSLPEDVQLIAVELLDSIFAGKLTPALAALAAEVPLRRYANHAVGRFWSTSQQLPQAAAAFEREGTHPDAESSRQLAIDHYLWSDDIQSLQRLTADPSFAKLISPGVRSQIAAAEGDWWTVWWLQPAAEWDRVEFVPAVMSLFNGLAWFIVAIQAGQFTLRRGGSRLWLCMTAVGLGFGSIWMTTFLIYWQESTWGLVDSTELIEGLKFFVMGVGLREELSKLLLFLPLLPFVLKRRSELEALIVAACVGLGFAILENVSYFSAWTGTGAIARFLTANFFHMAATGVIGLGVARACWYGGPRIIDAIAIFIVIVFVHGLYDALLSLPFFAEYSFVHLVLYILLAYQFFHELRSLRARQLETISLTATFLSCVALLAGIAFVLLSYRFGCQVAGRMLVPEFLEMATLAFMFLREMPNSLLRSA